MDHARLWTLLTELAALAGVEVRLERLDGEDDYAVGGGLCRLGGRLVAFVERRLSPAARNRQLGRALAALDLDAMFVRPAVRQYLEDLAGVDPAGEDA